MRRDTGILIFPFSGDFLNSWKIYLESRASPSRGFDVDGTSALLNAEKSWHEVVERSLWRDLEHWLKAIPKAKAERFLTTDRTD